MNEFEMWSWSHGVQSDFFVFPKFIPQASIKTSADYVKINLCNKVIRCRQTDQNRRDIHG